MKFVFVLLFFAFSGFARAAVVEKTLASVGGEVITQTELSLLKKQMSAGLFPDSLLFKYFPKKKILSSQKTLLDFIITSQVLAQVDLDAEKQNINLDSQTEASIKKTRGKLSHKQFAKKLRSYGLSYADYKDRVKSFIRADILISQNVLSKIAVSENEIDSYFFTKYGRKLFTSFQYEFSYVEFPNTQSGRSLSSQFIEQLSLESFTKAAKNMGLKRTQIKLKDAEINPSMFKHLKNLSVSQNSPAVLVGNRLLVFNLDWKQPYLKPSQQQAKMKIEKQLSEQYFKKEMAKWLQEQKNQSFVQMHSH